MPTVMITKGYRFFFYSSDRGEPVHIHVEKAHGLAKYWLEPIGIAKSVGFSRKELREIRNVLRENWEVLTRSWYEFFED